MSGRRRRLRPRLTLWLANASGEPAFGKGRMIILETIDEQGSLTAAAASLGMSYRALWARIRRSEKRLGFPLVVSHAGRGHDSGTVLTPEAREIIARYRELLKRVTDAADRAARDIFE